MRSMSRSWIDIESLDEKQRAQIESQLNPQKSVEAPREPVKPTKHEVKLEKELQSLCENWLSLRGYLRMTANNAERQFKHPNTACSGWFGHWFNNKRNPLISDLLIIDMANRCLRVELKTRNKWQPGQREMCQMGAWVAVFDFIAFEDVVIAWEIEGEK